MANGNAKSSTFLGSRDKMDLFDGFAQFTLLVVGLVAAVIVIAAIVSAFHGNFIGLLIIALVLVFSVKRKK